MNYAQVSGVALLVITTGLNAANGGDHHRSGHHGSGHHNQYAVPYGNSGHHNQYTVPYVNSGHHNQYTVPYVNSGHHNQNTVPYVNSGHHNQYTVPYVNSGHHNQYVVPHGSSYVLPHDTHNSGSYYTQNDNHYYYPQTTSVGNTHGTGHGTQYQPQQIQFGGFSQLDDLAGRLETMSNSLCLDLHHNYSHNKNYNAIYREAYQILETAKYIHTAKHQRNHKAVQERLSGLDKLAHHVESELAGWSRDHHQQVGQLGLQSKMKQIQSTLHHLLNDVGVKPTSVTQGHH